MNAILNIAVCIALFCMAAITYFLFEDGERGLGIFMSFFTFFCMLGWAVYCDFYRGLRD